MPAETALPNSDLFDTGSSEGSSPPTAARAKTPLISIIVPVYNEFYHIERVVQRILKAPMPENTAREIILIDDGSTDGTADVLRSFKDHPEVHLYHAVINSGKGRAVRAGLKFAKGDVVVFQDGDQEYDPSELCLLVQPILEGKAMVVYGSRFRGRVHGMRFPYWLVNKLLVGAVGFLYGKWITDEATAYKAFQGDLIRSLPLECKRFEFCPEVTAKVLRKKLTIHEVPISYKARTVDEGKKIRFLDAVEAFWTLMRYRFWKPR